MILDLAKSQHVPLIYMYKKCKGIALINKYLPHLSPLNKMYVINSEKDWEQVKEEFPADMMTVRCDCPRGVDSRLPEGQTFHRSRVNQYIRDVKSAVPDSVIILQDMKEGTNERIHTIGAFNLDVQIGKRLDIEYAGPCQDCGALSKGKGCYEAWSIPWEDVPFMKDSAVKQYRKRQINQEQYEKLAKERIEFLAGIYPDKIDEIVEAMPKTYDGIKLRTFRDLREQVIFPIYIQQEQLQRDGISHFGVELNVVEDERLVPFEIAVPDRFRNNSLSQIR